MSDWYGFSRQVFMAEQRAAFSTFRPQSFVLVTGITADYGDDVVRRTPLWTRHMLGVMEAERDLRRYR